MAGDSTDRWRRCHPAITGHTATLKEEIERVALIQNRSLTDFATDALVQTARKVLVEQVG
jgi:hypothetical protein